MTPPAQPDDQHDADASSSIRVGHAERDAVIEILRTSAGDGRLDTDELTERIEAAMNAKFYSDLDAIVADLPVEPPSNAIAPRPPDHGVAASMSAASAPGHYPRDPLVVRAGWDNSRLREKWIAVPFIRLEPVGATAELNFLEAVVEHNVIEVEVTSGMGSSVIVVPEGWGVNINRLSTGWGTAKSRVAAVPDPGRPMIVVSGSLGMGSFVARHANYFDKRRLEKR